MADKNNVYNNNDSMDINELAALNDDISNEMLEQLTAQITQNIAGTNSEDAALFEEPVADNNTLEETKQSETDEYISKSETTIKEVKEEEEEEKKIDTESKESTKTKQSAKKDAVKLDESFDDNFIKKYKAKLNKQAFPGNTDENTELKSRSDNDEPIEKISQGNITEKTISQEQIEYNDSLDFLDGNVKYSKYVIYVDPQNVDFIESLTVKERKNLINGILKQQGDIAMTKRRFKVIQTVIRHAIITILTITLSIPIIYYAINSSLEATINNHRQSQTVWQQLYKEHGKISAPK